MSEEIKNEVSESNACPECGSRDCKKFEDGDFQCNDCGVIYQTEES